MKTLFLPFFKKKEIYTLLYVLVEVKIKIVNMVSKWVPSLL